MAKKLVDTQNILTRITNHIPMIVFRWKNEENWPVEYVTENVKEVLGYEREEFISGSIKYSDIIDSADIGQVTKEVNSNQKKLTNNYFIHKPYRLIRKDGQIIWVEDRTYIERDEYGNILYYEGVILEITNRIRAEMALEKSRKQYSDLFEKSADANLVIRDSKFVDCNQAAVEMLGYKSKKELIDTHPSEISPPLQPDGQDSQKKANEMMRLAYEKGSHRFEWIHKKANGDLIPVEVLLTYITDEDDSKVLHTTWTDISLRKKAELELRESAAKFKDFTNMLPQIVYEMDVNGRFTYLNDYSFEFTGHPKSLMEEGFTVFDIVHPDDLELLKNNIGLLITKGEAPFDIYHIVLADGSPVPVHVYTSRVIKDNELVGFRGIVVDISEQQNARLKLEESEERYRTLADVTIEGVFLHDLGNVQDANESLLRLIGYSREELIGKNIIDLCVPEEYKPIVTEKALKHQTDPYRIVAIRKDGTPIHVELESRNVNLDTGNIRVTAVRDITERLKAEEALSKSEARYRSVLENTRDMAYQLNLKTGQYEYVNPSSIKVFGYTPEELIKKDMKEFAKRIHPEDKENVVRMFRSFFENTDTTNENLIKDTEYRWKHKNGEYRWYHDSRNLIYDENGSPEKIVGIVRDIAERKEAQLALEESEQRYRNFVNHASEGIYRIDFTAPVDITLSKNEIKNAIRKNAIIGEVNEALAMMYGYKIEEMVGQKAVSVAPDYDERILLALESENFQVRQLETEDVDKNGDPVFLSESYSAVVENNLMVRIWGMQRNITQRKITQTALKESEEKHRTYIQNAPDGIFVVNEKGEYQDANPAACLLTGYSRDELLSISIADLVSPNEIEKSMKEFGGLLKTGKLKTEVMLRKKDGTDILTSLEAVKISENTYMGFGADITDRKKAETELKASEEKLSNIFNNSTNMFYSHTIDHVLTYLSPQVEDILGYTPEEAKRNWTELASENPINKTGFENTVRAIETGKPQPYYELELIHKSGRKVWVEVREAPVVKNGKTTAIVGALTDITDRHRDEEEKAKLRDQLNQAQKLESVGRLAGGVAHDFNNMLEVIIGNVELAMMDMDSSNPLYSDLQEIEKAAQRSADLTGQLLAFARKQTISPKVLNLNTVVNGMLKMLGRLIGEDIDLAWLPCNNIKKMRIDPAQVDQILANLCVNARDAIKDVGKVTIETQNITIDKEYCTINPECVPGEYVMLAVSDDGSGMEKEVLENLFEPFFTTKGLNEGTGLGLATVFGIVKQNKGFINVYSEVDQGTSFKIYLPAFEGTDNDIVEHFNPLEVKKGDETILVVEDEPSILQLGKRMIEGLGYHVLTASTPGEAIEISRESGKDIHLLITDVVMPEMNGRDLAKQVLVYHPTIKRLFMSGYTANVIAHHGVLDEGVHFIQKPFRLNELAEKIRNALEE